eukprot:TRINITY_DN24759_c0_g1_i1.p1 TRINITY_DN24759_c0_g1~~TRINITY_DN24759_c0_g1_i1.p1  ORF type:complete len:547 (-),score=81.31 TRINITY_DN24759_c0_g1_i1:4-1644(-)
MSDRDLLSSASNSEDEPEDLVDHKEDQSGVWTLTMDQNIYCMSLLSPLTPTTKKAACTSITSATMLLAVNLVLQLLVLSKVEGMTSDAKNDAESIIFFEAGGNCMWMKPEDIGSHTVGLEWLTSADIEGQGPPGHFYNCGNLAVSATKNVSTLDLNGDGMWDLEEAQELQQQWYKNLGRLMNLDHVHKALVRYATQGRLVAQHGVPQNASAIPASWLQAESGKLSICAITSPDMCGNMEVRGILRSLFAEADDRNDRMELCEDTVGDYCPRVFGVLWKSFKDYVAQGCGSIEKTWNATSRVSVGVYDMTNKYVSSGGAVVSTSYLTFLLLIVVIWWLSIFTEIRKTLDWWIVVAFIDSTKGDASSLKDSDDKLEVVSIPMCHKIYLIILNIAPRTVIVIWLSITGTQFLISADNYSDLVLNSVALGFLIEIDEMIYTAVTSHRNNKNLERCEEVKVRHRFFGFVDKATFQKYNTVSLFNTMLVLGISIYFVISCYTGRHGKEDMADAFRCLCHSAGNHCVEAHVMGGDIRGIHGVSLRQAGKFHLF